MAEQLIKTWDNWEDGIGYPVDGDHHGYWGPSTVAYPTFIGTNNSLRVPSEIALTSTTIVATYVIKNFFQIKKTSGDYNLVALQSDPTSVNGRVSKIDLTPAAFGHLVNSTAYANESFGHPVRYQGSWYFTSTNDNAAARVMRKMAGGTLTVTAGDADSGDGHLVLIGNQMAKVQRATGISILTTAADPLVNANWGSDFPCGDDTDSVFGAAGLQGLDFILRGKGLYTFNDRGRAGLVYEDLAAWQEVAGNWWGIDNWKGGLIFTHPTGIYYYRLGELPRLVSPGVTASSLFVTETPDYNELEYHSIRTIGDFVYCVARDRINSIYWILCGQAKNGNPADIAWSIIASSTVDTGLGIVTDAPDDTFGQRSSLWLQSASNVFYIPLTNQGSPILPVNSGFTATAIASAYMSELVFPASARLTKLIVYVDNLSADSEQFQFSGKINGATPVNFGGPISANSRHEIPLGYTNVYAVSLGVKYTGAATVSAHMGAGIRRIELWGDVIG